MVKLKEKTDEFITRASEKLNYCAGIMLGLMMLTTCIDVVLRFFRHPIPGTYELVGFFASLAIAFSLSGTSLGKGHIAVEYLVDKLPLKYQKKIERINCFISSLIFMVITLETFKYSIELFTSKEVSMTLSIPLYPFAAGLSLGCAMVSLVMLFQSFNLVHYGSSPGK